LAIPVPNGAVAFTVRIVATIRHASRLRNDVLQHGVARVSGSESRSHEDHETAEQMTAERAERAERPDGARRGRPAQQAARPARES